MGSLGFIGGLSTGEIVVVLILGLLLFGSRLPQVGRSLGKSFSEFKRGLRGLENEFDSAEREADRQLDEEERLAADQERGQQPATPPERGR